MVSGLPGTYAKWDQEPPERPELFFKLSHFEYLGPPPPPFFFFFEASGILVPQPLTEPAPLAVEALSLDHERPGKSQLAIF